MMKKIQLFLRLSVLPVLVVMGLVSCSKKEFLPPEQGQAIPFTDTARTLRETLVTSPYSLYWEAYKRSHMEDMLNTLSTKLEYTLLVPDNAAFEAMGMNLATIRRTSPDALDSLLLLHCISGRIDPDALALQNGNILGVTLLTNSTYREAFNPAGGYSPIYSSLFTRVYRYRHYVGIENGNIWVNGKPSGMASRAMLAKGVTLLPINRVLKRPVKDIIQTLQDDGRFSLYLQSRAYNDEQYTQLGGYLYAGVFTLDQMSTQLRPDFVHFFSVFAPTDEAFHKAGINDLEDLKQLDSRSVPYIWDFYGNMSGYFPSDSILNNHFWQLNNLVVSDHKTEGGGTINLYYTPLVFYSNDLKNENLDDLITLTALTGSVRKNNLRFTRNGDDIKIRVNGSDAEPATIIEKDVETLNGPIHVVDRLLIPPGFKLN